MFTRIIFLHCGNVNILNDIKIDYSDFFNDDNFYFITCHSEEIKKQLIQIFPLSIITIIENKGADIGGFLNSLQRFSTMKSIFKDINQFYIIHTKTNKEWRDKMLRNILNNDLSNYLDQNIPIIVGSSEYKYSNNKMINRLYIEDIFKRNNLQYNYRNFYDEYIFDINDNPDRDIISIDPDFYRNYENDLNNMTIEESKKHWEIHGINEFHRISSPHYIKSYGKKCFFIAGTCFATNRIFIDSLLKIDLLKEFEILESGYNLNNIPRKTHSWEYFYGLYTYCQNGKVIGVNINGDEIDNDNKFNVDIYRNTNRDLCNFTNSELISHYNRHGKKEKRIHSSESLIKRQSFINVDINKSSVAFFLIIPGNNTSGGYRTLLKYINHLYNNGINIDLYFGHSFHDIKKIMGYSVVKEEINNIINIIDSYNEIDVSKFNFFLGYNCIKNYSIIVANAWQTAEAVYYNKHFSNEIVYIIQDEEYLFFEDKKHIDYIKSTYKPEYKYFCVTKYLSNKFKEMGLDVTESFLGVETNIYFNKFKERKDEVVISYYKEKKGRLPKLVEKIIDEISKKYICHVFPSSLNKENVINHMSMTPFELNKFYNKYKVGIIFSNTNPSRLGYEMNASGMSVIEYNSEFTKYDMSEYLKYSEEDNIIEMIDNLIENNNHVEVKSSDQEKNNVLSFFYNILMLNKDVIDIYNKINLLYNNGIKKYNNKTAICISGSYRSFDICKHLIKYNVLDRLNNYNIFILLSDENETDIEIKEKSIRDFFGEGLVYFSKTSEFTQNIKDYEYEEYQKFREVCDIQNVAFNTIAQHRRYYLDNIKNNYDSYEYTVILRLDVLYTIPIVLSEKIMCHNDTLFVGETNKISNILLEIGKGFNRWVKSFPENLSVLLKINPEYIYKNIMDYYKYNRDENYSTIHVRTINGGYNLSLFKAIEYNGYFIIYPNIDNFPDDFEVERYKFLNKDLRYMTKFEALNHYSYAGRFENRKYK